MFEQSGTWKKEFIKLGIPAEDYDIQNEFGETDHVIDLYSEIEKGYEGWSSVFDDIKEEDIVLAFFPCTRFDCQIQLSLSGSSYQFAKWSDLQKLQYSMQMHKEVAQNYMLISKLFTLSLRGGGE